MKTIQLKTNINCSSCVATVTPTLNDAVGKENWKVDTQNPKKILTVKTDDLNESDVIRALEQVGYKGESLQ